MRKLNKKDLEDLIVGCAILGTGGGGSPRKGLSLLKKDLAAGYQFELVSPDEVPDGAWVASPYMCGSVSPEEDEGPEEMECLTAFEALEDFLGVKLHAAVATEIGGGNTAVALSVAARKGIPILDADPAGRSVPELQHSTFAIYGIPIDPLAVATLKGDVLILKEVSGDERAEEIVRSIAVLSDNRAGVTDHPMEGKTLKGALIPGTLSKALAIGQAVRKAQEEGEDPVVAAAQAGGGMLLFRGKVTQADWKIEAGFTVGELLIQGEAEFSGHEYRIWFKNEHIISWLDGVPDATAPDLICVLDPRTGEAITNPNCQVGMQVGVIGYPAPEAWRTPKGLELLGPAHFGFEVEYRPLEENPRLR